MKRSCLFNALALGLMLVANTTLADTTFITDKISVELFSSTFQRGVLVTTVNSGTIVEVIETDGDYSKVRAPDAQEGWLHNKYLSTEKPVLASYQQLMAKHKQLEEELAKLKSKLQNSAETETEKAVLDKIRNDLSQAKKTIDGLENQLKEKTTALQQTKQQLVALEKQHQDSLKNLPAASSENPSAATTEQQTAESDPQPEVEAPATPSTAPKKQSFDLDYPIALKWLLVAALLSVFVGTYLGYSWLDNKIARKHGGVRLR